MPLSVDTLCLFLDVDGTLLDLAPRPVDVVVPLSLPENLRSAERRLNGALALVSGRSIENLDALFAPLRLRATGVHGAEMRFSPGERVRRDAAAALPADAWMELSRLLLCFPGAFAENKQFAFAVHYRSAPGVGPMLKRALRVYLAERPGLVMMDGHYVFEIKRTVHDKGKAIEEFMKRQPFARRTPIFIGDDTTDEPGFVAARELGGQAYSVGRAAPRVSGCFAGPAAVRAWLADLVHGRLGKP